MNQSNSGGSGTSRPVSLADRIIRALALAPLPREGGYFRETYRSSLTSSREALTNRYGGSRSLATAIYYLLSPDSHSALHRLPGDELFHFYAGDPVEMLMLNPDGTSSVTILGSHVLKGMSPQVLVPGGVWQGSRLVPGGRFALMGTTMSPGFDPADYEAGRRGELVARYHERAELIAELTPALTEGNG